MADGVAHDPHHHHGAAQLRNRTNEEIEEKPDDRTLTPDAKTVTREPTYISSGSESAEHKLPHQIMARANSSIDLDDYFVGPRSLDRHSKWPMFLRLHGSVLPRMIIPLLLMACWSTLITAVSRFLHPLGIDSILTTVLGFVVGLALSLRSSTAYERYAEGRKYWALLAQSSRTLARIIWIHNDEREGEEGKEDVLHKLSGINLIVAYAISLKHKLRFEPEMSQDLHDLVGHLDTFAKQAHDPNAPISSKPGALKAAGQYLSVPMAMSNPRKRIKRADKPLGNLPVEILNHISAYVDQLMNEGLIKLPVYQSQVGAVIASMEDVMTGTERVLNTPLPLAYTILISQITWIYVLALPFQLVTKLDWVTIPATMIATYIIHGLAAICAEIENPFGNDVNDLPLDIFCEQIAADLDIITSAPPPKPRSFTSRSDNLVLHPLSKSGTEAWKSRSVDDIRAALRAKATIPPVSISTGSRERVLSARGSHDLA